jgi:hypothetical protein
MKMFIVFNQNGNAQGMVKADSRIAATKQAQSKFGFDVRVSYTEI